jgi:hypothetical protein
VGFRISRRQTPSKLLARFHLACHIQIHTWVSRNQMDRGYGRGSSFSQVLRPFTTSFPEKSQIRSILANVNVRPVSVFSYTKSAPFCQRNSVGLSEVGILEGILRAARVLSGIARRGNHKKDGRTRPTSDGFLCRHRCRLARRRCLSGWGLKSEGRAEQIRPNICVLLKLTVLSP